MLQFGIMLLSDDADVEFVSWCESIYILFENFCINYKKFSHTFVSIFLVHKFVSLFVFHYFKSNIFVLAVQFSNKKQIYVKIFY